jgi:hypothetical protein
MKKGLYSLLGFVLFVLGFLALVLQMVGVQIAFLTWLDAWGGGIGLLLRVLMIVAGLVIVIITRSGEQQHEEFFND